MEASGAKHTAGPWTYYADLPSTEPNWHIVTNASRMRVLANVHIEPGNAVDEANARLIAAAPTLAAEVERLREINAELVKALKLARDYLSQSLGSPGWTGENPYTVIDAAIAKAEAV